MKYYLVVDPESKEGIVFDNVTDANFAATGKSDFDEFSCSVLGVVFRETYAEDDMYKVFPVAIIDINLED